MRHITWVCYYWIISMIAGCVCAFAEICDNKLGMESKRIPDESITASSQKSDDHSPSFARVDSPKAWCSKPDDKSPYIQIQLDEPKLITAITTQGSSRKTDLSWSRKYEVKYLEKGNWKSYKEQLIGNRNSGALRKNKLDPVIRSQTIRIYPKDPFSMLLDTTNSSCLKLELHGCSAPGCNGGIPLGMRSGDIPDKYITASSQTAQHPAHHGRLGRDTYWCTNNERTSYIEMRLPKRYKITEARVQITQNSEKIKSIALLGEVFPVQWIDFHYETPPYNSDQERIVPREPFIARSSRIAIRKSERIPVCLRTEVYGCEIPRGCIMPGSAVLTKENFGYRKGYFGENVWGFLEVFLVGKTGSILKNRTDVILDEKPIVHDLVKGITLVVGEDVNSPGSIRQGIIEQIGDSVCTIRSNDGTWKSKLDDIRVVKIPDFCR